MSTMSASEARAALPELLTRVQDGEEITITRHGAPVAVLVHPKVLRSRRAEAAFTNAAHVHDLLELARTDDSAGPVGLTPERAEELVRAIRVARDA